MKTNYLTRWGGYALRRGRSFMKRPPVNLRISACEVQELHPGEESIFPPCITLSGQIDKITGNFFGPVAEYIDYATQESVVHRPTKAYRVQDVIYDNGYLYKGFVAEHISSLGTPTFQVPRVVDTVLLSSSSSGSRYFGDWLLGDNLLELLADEMGMQPLKVWPHSNYPHLADLNRFLGLRETYAREVMHIENLLLIDDAGYNEEKRERLKRLRIRLRDKLQLQSAYSRHVYIRRGRHFARERALVNEQEVMDFLSSQGFVIVDPSQSSAGEVLSETLGASIVVGVEGSQLGYGFLGLNEGGLMLALEPPYHFQSAFRPRCVSVGINWGFLVGDEQSGGFTIDVDDLKCILSNWIA